MTFIKITTFLELHCERTLRKSSIFFVKYIRNANNKDVKDLSEFSFVERIASHYRNILIFLRVGEGNRDDF